MSKIDHRELTTILNGCKQLQVKWQRGLYDLLFDPILITVSNFHITDAEAEDLMQETFIRVFRNLDSYDASKSEITTWACIIAKRLTINFCKSKSKRNMNLSMEGLENLPSLPEASSIDFDWEHMNRVLSQIPEKYSAVFELSVYQGMKHQSIADQLDISESSSRVYLSRAIELIKKNFKSIA